MFRQLPSVETLVPPNLTTTQRDAERADMVLLRHPPGRLLTVQRNETRTTLLLVVFERILQVFLEPTIGQDFLETAPRGFATFGRARLRANAPVHFVEDAVVVGVVFRFGQELFV